MVRQHSVHSPSTLRQCSVEEPSMVHPSSVDKVEKMYTDGWSIEKVLTKFGRRQNGGKTELGGRQSVGKA